MKSLKSALIWSVGILLFTLFYSTDAFARKGDAPKLTDPEIASVAVTANQIDVDYAAIAAKKSKDAAILRFAKTMKDDHTAVIKQATELAKKLGVTPKTNAVTKSLLDGAKKESATLNSKAGKEFNKAYINNEVAYHEAVISTVETVLIPQTQNKELKAFLEKVMPSLKMHLEHAKKVQSELK